MSVAKRDYRRSMAQQWRSCAALQREEARQSISDKARAWHTLLADVYTEDAAHEERMASKIDLFVEEWA